MRQQNQQEETEQTLPRMLIPPAEAEKVGESESVETELAVRKIEALRRAGQRRKRLLSWMRTLVVGIAITLSLLISLVVTVGNTNSLSAHVLMGLLVAQYLGIASVIGGTVEGHNRAVRPLANTDDLRAVGVLAEALSGGDTVNSIAGSALIRLLPQMRHEDAALLTPSQRRCLRDALHPATNPLRFSRYNPTLAVAILNALAQIGDSEDLPVLEQLAQRKAGTEEQERVRTAAEACVSHLKARFAGAEEFESSVLDRQLRHQATTQLSPEVVEGLSSRLRQLTRLRRRNLKVTLAGALGGIGLAGISFANSAAGHPTSPLLMTGLLGSMGLMGLFAVRGLYAQRNLTQALIHTDDLRLVGPLVESAATSEISGDSAVMALTPLLLRLQSSDAGLLDANGRDSLNKAIMRHQGNTEFVLAALTALQQIGDGRALPVVQKLADRADRSAAGQSVRAAALECLPFLQLRAAQDQASQMLLRASEGAVTPPNTLLRPVKEMAPIVAEELLRPGTPRPESEGEEAREEGKGREEGRGKREEREPPSASSFAFHSVGAI